VRHSQHDGEQYIPPFQKKGGKSRGIPVRLELERDMLSYLETAGIGGDARDRPLFRSSVRKKKQITANTITGKAICETVMRRLKADDKSITCLGQDHHHGKCCLHLL
jgi:integrase/recombinase XerD